MCKAGCKSGVQVHPFKLQQLEERSSWEILDQMDELPSIQNLIGVLQKCRKNKNLGFAKSVYAHICSNGLESHKAVSNYIVPTFVECGSMSDAQQVFDRLVHRNVYSWTSLILGYSECGQLQHALNLYQKMQKESVNPRSFTFLALLKACAMLKDVERGREIHVEIRQKGFERDVFVGNTLVDMYAKCGSLAEAREVFEKLPVRDVVSWNVLIAGYAEHGRAEEALKCFEQMELGGISPNAITFVCVLKACGSIAAINKGREIHADITRKGLGRDGFIGNTLIDMYSKCGSLSEAREVFDKMLVRDVVSWTALIAGYAENGPGQEALRCFEQMQSEGVSPNAVTFVCVLKACGSIGAIAKGREIHNDITKQGFEKRVSVGNTLVDMYAKCGSVSEAQQVFDKLPVQDVVTWNALIAGYAEHGCGKDALICFEQMQLKGICPDAVTFICTLKACRSIGAIDKGVEMHAEIIRKGFESDVGNTLVDMYVSCGSLAEARKVFNKLPVRKVESWTALIAGYAELGPGQEALKYFEQMQQEGISADVVTFVCVLKACGSIGALDKGREIHADITQRGLESVVFVGTTLIDMYAKCGSLMEAQKVFDKLPFRNVVSWTAMVKGYGRNDEGDMAVQCFEKMKEQGMKPDDVTFTCLLDSCSRAGMVLKGQELFNVMSEAHGIVPRVEHYTCIVDLLAKSGHLYEAEIFLESTQYPPLCRALLSACRTYGDAELGMRCFTQLMNMNSECAASYVLMAKLYAGAGRWDDAYRIEDMRKLAGAKKKPAGALIEVNKKVHDFVVGDDKSKEISAMLNIMSSRMKEEGHVPKVNLDLTGI